MLLQPSNIQPSSWAGISGGAIDASDNVSISWQVNGSSDMTGFCFSIYPNTGVASTDATPVYTSPVISLSPAVPPHDAKGNPTIYTYTPSATTWASLGLSNGNEYKLQITQFASGTLHYWTIGSGGGLSSGNTYYYNYNGVYYYFSGVSLVASDIVYFDPDKLVFAYRTAHLTPSSFAIIPTQAAAASEVGWYLLTATSRPLTIGSASYVWTEQYSPSAFFTVAKPTVSLPYDGTKLDGSKYKDITDISYTFTPTVTLGAGDSVKSYAWTLTDNTANSVLVATGAIDTTVGSFSYDGFVGGSAPHTYTLTVSIITNAGWTASNTITVNVNYATSVSLVAPTVSCVPYGGYQIKAGITIGGDWYIFAIYQQDKNGILTKLYDLKFESGAENDKIIDFLPVIGEEFGFLVAISSSTTEDGIYTPQGIVEYPAAGEKLYSVCYNAYLLYQASQDPNDANVYHVHKIWRFGNNINAGGVSNNNAPNFLENFTGYRLKQPSLRRGRSGTLSALLSNAVNGKYADTVAQMEALYEASYTTDTFFLKDLKGNIYMVALSDPITQTIATTTGEQAVTVSIAWEEVGSMNGISLIQTPDDEGWNGGTQNG